MKRLSGQWSSSIRSRVLLRLVVLLLPGLGYAWVFPLLLVAIPCIGYLLLALVRPEIADPESMKEWPTARLVTNVLVVVILASAAVTPFLR